MTKMTLASQSSKPLRIALLGSGNAALTIHAPYIRALSKQWTIAGVVERGGSANAGRASKSFGPDMKIYTSIGEVMDDPEVDVTCVCTPNALHFENAKASILAKKHVVVDKPFCTTSEEAAELIKLAEENHVYVIPFQNRRFDNDFLTLRKLLENKTIKEVLDYESRYDCNVTWPLGDPSPAGGITFGLGVHIIDQAVCLFGKPSSVYAELWNGRGTGHPDMDDSSIIMLKYSDSNRRVMLRTTTFSTLEKQIRFVVRGHNTSYLKYGLDPQEGQTLSGMDVKDPQFGIEPESLHGTVHTLAKLDTPSPYQPAKATSVVSERGAYINFYRLAAEAITHGSEPPVAAKDALLGLQIIEAAQSSNRSGNSVRL